MLGNSILGYLRQYFSSRPPGPPIYDWVSFHHELLDQKFGVPPRCADFQKGLQFVVLRKVHGIPGKGW